MTAFLTPTFRELVLTQGKMTTLRLLLIGKTGNGKSTTGNTILGQNAFQPTRGLTSGTRDCKWVKIRRGSYIFEVTDTPGVCDTHRSEGEVEEEIAKCVATMTPGPDAILFVIKGSERFTKEEFEAFQILKEVFGEEMTKYLILILTCITPAEFEVYREKGLPPNLKALLEEADNRYVCFSDNLNDEASKHQEGEVLLQQVLDLKVQNKMGFYSNDLVEKFDCEMTITAQKKGVSIDELKEDIVEDRDPEFTSYLYQYVPSVLNDNTYCTVM